MANRSNATINQTLNYLLNKINNIPPPTTETLAQTLIAGNSAGTNDIDMNSNDITNIDTLSSTISSNLTLSSSDNAVINSTGIQLLASDFITMTANNDSMSLTANDDITLQSVEKGIVINGGDGNGGNNDITLTTIDRISTGGLIGNINLNSAGTNTLTSTGITTITAGGYINLVCNTGNISLTSPNGNIDIQPNNTGGITSIYHLLLGTPMNVNGFYLDNCSSINSASGISINETGGDITLNSSFAINMTAQNSSMGLNALNDITIQSTGAGNINTNAPNMNSYGNALPICFNQFENGTWSYTLGGQVFEDVFSASPINIALPTQFFADNPQSGYTSTRWQINFDMNCWNFVNAGDKGFAIYLSFLDNNGNLYEPFLYNNLTPFCKWDNPPTFSGANNQFKSVNWCDYVDFSGLAGSFDSNIRLQMNVAGDNPFINVDFKFKLGFTRIQGL